MAPVVTPVAREVAPVPQAVVPIQRVPAAQAVIAVAQAVIAVAQAAGPVVQAILAAQAVVPALRVEREQRFPPMDTVRVTTPAPPIAQWTKILIRGLRARVRSLTGSEVA